MWLKYNLIEENLARDWDVKRLVYGKNNLFSERKSEKFKIFLKIIFKQDKYFRYSILNLHFLLLET